MHRSHRNRFADPWSQLKLHDSVIGCENIMVAVAIQPNKAVNGDVKCKEVLAQDVIRWCQSFESILN